MLFKKFVSNKPQKENKCYIAIASIRANENLDLNAIFKGEFDADFKQSSNDAKIPNYFKVRCEICTSIEDAIYKGKKLANSPNRVWILTMDCNVESVKKFIATGHFSKQIIQATNSQDWQLFNDGELDEKKIRTIENPYFAGKTSYTKEKRPSQEKKPSI